MSSPERRAASNRRLLQRESIIEGAAYAPPVVVLLPERKVGVLDNGRTYDVVRAVTRVDGMTADLEAAGTIEWG